MDQAIAQNFKKTLSDSNNLLFVLPEYINTDTIAACATLFSFTTNTLKKKAIIASPRPIPSRFKHILNAFRIEEKMIVSEIKPLQYVITLSDVEKDLDLSVNRKEGEVEIVMVPKLSDIDFQKIKLDTVGAKFDLFITFNSTDFTDFGSLYNKSKNIFEHVKIASINSNFASAFAKESVYAQTNSTASESVYDLLTIFGASIDQNSREILAEGIVLGTDGIHKINSANTLRTVFDITNSINLPEILQNFFYKFSNEGLLLRKKIFERLNIQNNVAHSHISKQDIFELGLKGSQLDGIDFLPFALSEKITNYVMSYEDEKDIKVLVSTPNIPQTYTTLKNAGYNVAKSTNLILVITDQSAESVVSTLTSGVQSETPVSTEKEQDLFQPTTSESQPSNSATYTNVDNEKNTPFKPATEAQNTQNSGPFQSAQ